MTQIELAAPACLTLAAACVDGRPVLLGIALRHPPVHLLVRPAPALGVSGARADLAYRQAERVLAAFAASPPSPTMGEGGRGGEAADIEIELAIPSHMGLASAPMLGLSVARALALLAGRPADDAASLAQAAGLSPSEGLGGQAFAGGGLLLVDEAGAAMRRLPLDHADEARDWAFVLALPRPPAGAPDDLEEQLTGRLWQAAGRLDARAEALTDQLWRAAEGDDITAFAAALGALQALADTPAPSPEERAVLDLMRGEGALACGRAPTGLGFYALVHGAEASRGLRAALGAHMGHQGGTVMATICEPSGARHSGA